MRDYVVRSTEGEIVTVSQMPLKAVINVLDEYKRGLRDGPMVNNPDVSVADMLDRLRLELVIRSLPKGA